MTTASPNPLYATVAIDQPVDATYTYLVPPMFQKDAVVGARVTIPFGRSNRLTPATILSLSATPPELPGAQPGSPTQEESSLFEFDPPPRPSAAENSPFKSIAEVLTAVPPIPEDLLKLAQWISAYYCSPIGMTLASMVPAAVKRGARLPANLIVHLSDRITSPEEQLKALKIAPKTRRIFEKLHFFLSDGPKPEQEVLHHAEIARSMLKRLLALKLLTIEREIKLPESPPIGANLCQFQLQNTPLVLSPDQQAADDEISALLDQHTFGVRLIHGVTGSGKTELYIRAIQKVVDRGQCAIVLVPEISLTPQAVRRFTARFPRVAVLHSGLKPAERHQHYHAIASGWAQVVVGARSAIFAPAHQVGEGKGLGIIVVDEEHDPSYKQDNLPKYHARDVAIRRAQMLNIPILLGSATPALESWQNAQPPAAQHGGHKDWKLLSLRSRPLGVQMPRVVVVDMKGQAKERRGLHILSTTLEHHLRQTLEQKKQAIFLLNRRGYAHYVMCPRCDWVLMCENCDATMVVHRTRNGETARGRNGEVARGRNGEVARGRNGEVATGRSGEIPRAADSPIRPVADSPPPPPALPCAAKCNATTACPP